jgi:hypothetical protein
MDGYPQLCTSCALPSPLLGAAEPTGAKPRSRALLCLASPAHAQTALVNVPALCAKGLSANQLPDLGLLASEHDTPDRQPYPATLSPQIGPPGAADVGKGSATRPPFSAVKLTRRQSRTEAPRAATRALHMGCGGTSVPCQASPCGPVNTVASVDTAAAMAAIDVLRGDVAAYVTVATRRVAPQAMEALC